ncbi:hypothetical protein ES765_03145 [Maribacter sp. ACAM166]|nr:hypothetical protein ES765_03145 [Maribacter sp. ACAM166]
MLIFFDSVSDVAVFSFSVPLGVLSIFVSSCLAVTGCGLVSSSFLIATEVFSAAIFTAALDVGSFC